MCFGSVVFNPEPTELRRICGTSEVKPGGSSGKSNAGCSVEIVSEPVNLTAFRERLLGTGRRSDKSNGDSSVELAPGTKFCSS